LAVNYTITVDAINTCFSKDFVPTLKFFLIAIFGQTLLFKSLIGKIPNTNKKVCLYIHPTSVKNINGNKGFFRWPDWYNVLFEGAKIY